MVVTAEAQRPDDRGSRPSGMLDARDYDPATGRFISPDPLIDLGNPQQWNAYGYANSNPTTLADPSGQIFKDESQGGGGGTPPPTVKPAPAKPSPVPSPSSSKPSAGSWQPNQTPGGGFVDPRCNCSYEYPSQDDINKAWSSASTGEEAVHTALVFANTLALVGLTAFNAVQLGADPLTDAVEVADVAEEDALLSDSAEAKTAAPEASQADVGATQPAESGASLTGRLVTEDADKAISLARRATPEDGYFDVIGHGTETSVSGLSPQELAAQIRSTPSWGGQNVRLLACQSGCPVSNYGQNLANELGVTVKGANVDIFPQYNGVQKLAPGGFWFTYTPGG